MGNTQVAERGYAKGRAKREEILARAMTAFGESGYRGASLREIATRCEISLPGLLHHFPNKEALLIAVLERREEVDLARIRADGATGIAELRQLVELVADNAARPGMVEMFTTLSAEATSPDHPAHAYFVARYRTAIAELVGALQAVKEDGGLRDGIDPELAARELVALMDGLQVQWLLDPDALDMAAIVRDHTRRLLTVEL